jgi:hypothetical protein
MAKSKGKSGKRRKTVEKKNISWGGAYSSQKRNRDRFILVTVLFVLVLGGGLAWWYSFSAESNFQNLVAEGQAALAEVRTEPSKGRNHLSPGQSHAYASRFPTSGPHETVWTRTGFYDEPQPPTNLVHALEHGNVVIYYDSPGAETVAQLSEWAGLYDGQWDGIVVAPMRGLRERIVLTAWVKRLDLKTFDAAAAAAFVDAYRGRGPEHPVR